MILLVLLLLGAGEAAGQVPFRVGQRRQPRDPLLCAPGEPCRDRLSLCRFAVQSEIPVPLHRGVVNESPSLDFLN